MKNEDQLIQESINGSEESFRKLIDIYKNYVFAIILNFIKDHNEVENIAQEVFLQIYISLPKYKDDNFKAWIGRVTSNKTIDYLRNKERHFKEETINYSEEIIEEKRQDEVITPEDNFLNKENSQDIIEVCNLLPKIYKDVIIKHYILEKSYKEIAYEEDVSEKTIESRLYRGRKLFRENWREKNEAL